MLEGVAVDRPAMVREAIADDRHGWDGKGLGIGILISLPVWLGVALIAAAL